MHRDIFTCHSGSISTPVIQSMSRSNTSSFTVIVFNKYETKVTRFPTRAPVIRKNEKKVTNYIFIVLLTLTCICIHFFTGEKKRAAVEFLFKSLRFFTLTNTSQNWEQPKNIIIQYNWCGRIKVEVDKEVILEVEAKT